MVCTKDTGCWKGRSEQGRCILKGQCGYFLLSAMPSVVAALRVGQIVRETLELCRFHPLSHKSPAWQTPLLVNELLIIQVWSVEDEASSLGNCHVGSWFRMSWVLSQLGGKQTTGHSG